MGVDTVSDDRRVSESSLFLYFFLFHCSLQHFGLKLSSRYFISWSLFLSEPALIIIGHFFRSILELEAFCFFRKCFQVQYL